MKRIVCRPHPVPRAPCLRVSVVTVSKPTKQVAAEELLRGESSLDLRPYALERFEQGAAFPERLVL